MMNTLTAKEKKFYITLILVALIFFGAISIYFVSIGFNVRAMGDDFCTFSLVKSNGFLSTLSSYFGYRYGSSIFGYSLAALGGGIVPYMNFALFVAFITLPLLFVKNIFGKLDIVLLLVSILFGVALFSSLISLVPSTYDAIYYFGSSVVHTWPVVFFSLGAFLLLRIKKPKALSSFLMFCLLLFSIGFSEVFAFAALPLTAGLFGAELAFEKKFNYKYFIVFLSNAVGILIMYFLPARSSRLNAFVNNGVFLKSGPLEVVKRSFVYSWQFLYQYIFTQSRLLVIGLLLVTFAIVFLALRRLGYINRPNIKRPLLLLPLTVISFWFSFMPGSYIYKSNSADLLRSYATPTMLIILFVILAAYFLADFLAGLRLGSRFRFGVALLLVLFTLGTVIPDSLIVKEIKRTHSLLRDISMAYDAGARKIQVEKAKGVKNLTFESMTVLGENKNFLYMTTDKYLWINACAARFWGLESITAIDSSSN